MDSLAKSEHIVAAIVAHLAERGVQRTNFSVEDVGLELTEDNDKLFSDALRWLSDEGIIRSNERYDTVDGTENETIAIAFTLTSFGFDLLQNRFEGDLKLGAAIQQAKDGSGGYSNIGDLIGGILGGFTKTISS